jgi:hypothetical protein
MTVRDARVDMNAAWGVWRSIVAGIFFRRRSRKVSALAMMVLFAL